MNAQLTEKQQDGLRSSLIVKLKKTSHAACKACQVLKIRCEFDDQEFSTSCKRCARKKIECVAGTPSSKRCKLSQSADPTTSSGKSLEQPAQSVKTQNAVNVGNEVSADSIAQDQAQPMPLHDGRSQRSSTEQPQTTTDGHQARAPPQDTSTPSTISTSISKPTPHSSNEAAPGMMLFPISQIQRVLDIYDRRKQRLQFLEARVDDLEQSLHNNPPEATTRVDSERTNKNKNTASNQQCSLVAALGGALVRQSNITDLNALYNLLEDLGVDQSHYWTLYDNEEFRKLFPTLHGDDRAEMSSTSAEGEPATDSPLQQALDVVNRIPVSSAHPNATAQPY